MGRIIIGIGTLIKSGAEFDDWHGSGDALEGYLCMFRRVDPSLYREYFGYALWFHEGPEFPMLQMRMAGRQPQLPAGIEDGRLVSLHTIVENHPAVVGLSKLPMGWRAVRDGPDQPWQRAHRA